MSTPYWEGVRDSTDRRRVIYWRLTTGAERTQSLGSVARHPEGVRALLYDWASGNPARTELGYFKSVPVAKRVVEQAARGRGNTSVVGVMATLQQSVSALRRARESQ